MAGNSITEGKERIKGPDVDGVLHKQPGAARDDLAEEIARATKVKDANGPIDERRSTLESRAELRTAMINERTPARDLDPAAARQWAELDAGDFARMRSPERKEAALDALAANARHFPAYADELKQRSPVLFEASSRLNQGLAAEEAERAKQQAQLERQELEGSRRSAMSSALDAEALARVGRIRTEQSQAASTLLGDRPSLQPAPQATRTPPPEERPAATATVDRPAAPDTRTDAAERLIKRPIHEDELPDAIKRRYVVSLEKTGLLDQGRTEFSFRGGSRDGQAAFADAGKQLSTRLEDRDTIHSMIEVAKAKGWKEVTVAGSEEFRRQAWLDSKLNGLEVHGYEPREADKKRLADLQATKDKGPRNTITTNDRDRDEPTDLLRARMAKAVFHDGATLTPDEEKMIRRAHDAGDTKAAAGLRDQAQTRLDQDVKTVREMDKDELRSLAQVYDGPAAIDTDKRVRMVLDAAAQRHGIQVKPELKEERPKEPSATARTAKQIDGDRLSSPEQQAMQAMRDVLGSKGYESKFVDATMHELEARMRSQRVHLGAVVEHGPARYNWNPDKTQSYYVTLKTPRGHETVWGMDIKQALERGNVKVGDQIVLTNTGKTDVAVTEALRDPSGNLFHKNRMAERNGWIAQPIDRLTPREFSEASAMARRSSPALRVYDPMAPRVQTLPMDHLPPPRDANRDLGNRNHRER